MSEDTRLYRELIDVREKLASEFKKQMKKDKQLKNFTRFVDKASKEGEISGSDEIDEIVRNDEELLLRLIMINKRVLSYLMVQSERNEISNPKETIVEIMELYGAELGQFLVLLSDKMEAQNHK